MRAVEPYVFSVLLPLLLVVVLPFAVLVAVHALRERRAAKREEELRNRAYVLMADVEEKLDDI